jgi:hypothetical protein
MSGRTFMSRELQLGAELWDSLPAFISTVSLHIVFGLMIEIE